MSRIFLLLLILSTYSCNTTNHNYAYSIKFAFGGFNDKKIDENMTLHPYYLYKGNIIELALNRKQNTTIEVTLNSQNKEFEKITSNKITFDTIGVQIIDFSNDRFIQLDSFKNNFKIIKTGRYKDSPIGLKLNLNSNDKKDNFSDYKLEDTIINNEKLKFIVNKIKGAIGNDSILTTEYFVQKEGFKSIFNLSSKSVNRKMAFYGFDSRLIEQNLKVSIRIEGIRDLSKYEEDICEHIYSALKK
ncbi:hypothetical protein ACFOW1_04925 [Parasediminibacterium paludis]|uniref:Lipoprotein n=1 Tax=Parasediminibacterium paludis TaxID=908966 RepID=A0ABV8PX33_9BACT